MAVELTVPQLGESITEAVVGKWHKRIGESVGDGEAVVVLETDKVTVDVPAPAAGAILNITRKEGDRVKVGEVLGTITPGPAGATAKPSAAVAPAAAKAAENGKGGDDAGQKARLSPVAARVVE